MFEVVVLTLALSCAPRKINTGEGEGLVCLDSGPNPLVVCSTGSCITPEVLLSDPLEVALSKDFAVIPEVLQVLAERADSNLLIWIAVDSPEYEVRDRIFQKELEILDGFPEVNFDFNVILADGRDPGEFATGAQVVYLRA
jgi:hypothetical protein